MDSIVNPSHNHAGVFGWAISFLELDDFIILMCGAQLNQLKPAISFSFPKWKCGMQLIRFIFLVLITCQHSEHGNQEYVDHFTFRKRKEMNSSFHFIGI